MEIKKFTQIGTFSIILLGCLILIFSLIMLKIGFDNPGGYIMASFITILLICLKIFYKLTIYIDNQNISFKLGFGLIGKSYKLSEIKSCNPVTNSLIYGVGIHMLPNGILYNVSGLKAIELQFKNKKSVVRIGTDCPEDICSLVHSKLSNATIPMTDISDNKRTNQIWIFLVIAIIIPIVLILSSNQDTKAIVDQGNLKISGFYGLTVPIKEIAQIDTIPNLPEIALRTNGYAFGKTRTGNFRLADNSNVKLFIKVGFEPYILIHLKGQKSIYINFKDKQKTIELYRELLKNK